MSGTAAASRTETARQHALYEDVLAIATGALLASLGVVLYAKAVLLTGGITGLALLITYVTPIGFWQGALALNLPFFLLGWRRRGGSFVIRSVLAVAVHGALVEGGFVWIDIGAIDPLYAAIMGSVLIGIGLLILFRHDASLGGIGILALYIQDRYGIRAGYTQLALDVAIMVSATTVLAGRSLLFSIVGAVVLNSVLAIHHRAHRYIGVSRPLFVRE